MVERRASFTELRLENQPDAVPRARRFARSATDGLADDLAYEAELVAAELVTNATLHGRPPVLVRISASSECVRIEVEDAGRSLPMRVVQRTDAMTGRGLSLVAAVSSRWGVVPRDGGKVVWAELATDPGARASNGSGQDPGSVLDAWAADEPDGDRYTVHLGAVPTALLLSAKAHIDNVVRELSLLQQASASTGRPLPGPVADLVQTVTVDFAEARTEIKRQALAAAARGESVTDLELHLPAEAVDSCERYLAALDQADRYARTARLLTLAAPTSHRVFRGWYVRALMDQLRALAAGQRPLEPEPFAVVLADEVDRLARLEDVALRLNLLQKVNVVLTATATAKDMASVVVDAAAAYPGVESARVYLLTDSRTLRSVAWHAERPADPGLFDELSIDADLPGAEVARTRRPIVMKTLQEVYGRFPQMQGYYPGERSLHIEPLAIGERAFGILGMTFRGGEIGQESETEFVSALAGALSQALARLH